MSFTNTTIHYGLPQYVGSDKPTWLVDVNNANQAIDSAIFAANTAAAAAVADATAAQTAAQSAHTSADAAVTSAATANATAESAVSSATTAVQTANSASSAASAAGTTANSALDIANNASTQAGGATTNAAAAVTTANAANAKSTQAVADIAVPYDATKAYVLGAYCTYNGIFYKNIVPITVAHAFNVDEWDDVTVAERLTNLEGATGGMGFYAATFDHTAWTATTFNGQSCYMQTVACTGINASVNLGMGGAKQTNTFATNKLLNVAAALVNAGYVVPGNSLVTAYVETAPVTDVTIEWIGKVV